MPWGKATQADRQADPTAPKERERRRESNTNVTTSHRHNVTPSTKQIDTKTPQTHTPTHQPRNPLTQASEHTKKRTSVEASRSPGDSPTPLAHRCLEQRPEGAGNDRAALVAWVAAQKEKLLQDGVAEVSAA